jgi:hypothetical protein
MLAYSIALLLAGTVLGVTTIACSTAYSHQVDKALQIYLISTVYLWLLVQPVILLFSSLSAIELPDYS